MTLETHAIGWLRFYQRCPIAITERSPLCVGGSRPDVIGVTKTRHIIEVEVKRTVSDFRANAKKWHVRHRDNFIHQWPRLFYFLVPPELAEKVLPEVPEWAGLITPAARFGDMNTLKRPIPNRHAPKLHVRHVHRLVGLQTNQLWSAMRDFDALYARMNSEADEPYGIEYQI